MKKLLSFCLTISMIFSMIPFNTLAVEPNNLPIQDTASVQQEIDAILTELNDMATDEKMAELLVKENIIPEEKVAAVKAKNDRRKQYLNNRLESLGVNTINPDDPDDMASLEAVMLGNNSTSPQSIPAPPDLHTLANCYTLRQYNSTVTIDGTNYNSSYIYVIDDKSYSNSPLTQTESAIKLIGKENSVLRDVLEYQFSFGLSAYLGTIPGGWIANWVIGTACSALNSYNPDSIISYKNNKDIYSMLMVSVTQMMYVYVYSPDNGEWNLCGTRAFKISYDRTESIAANIGGTAVAESINYARVNSSTGGSSDTYVRAFVNGTSHTIHYVGSFTINANNGIAIRFTPGFAPYPGQLI